VTLEERVQTRLYFDISSQIYDGLAGTMLSSLRVGIDITAMLTRRRPPIKIYLTDAHLFLQLQDYLCVGRLEFEASVGQQLRSWS